MARLGLPPGVRRALTFWRRSIQARVVASTLLLSAIVISGVGWFLLTSTKDGLLDHRVKAVLAEADATTDEARTGLDAASGTELNAARQQRELADQIIARGETRGFSVILGVPADEGARLSDGGPEYTTDLDLSSVPASLEKHFEQVAPTAWTYTTIVTRDDEAGVVEASGIVVGSQEILPSDDYP